MAFSLVPDELWEATEPLLPPEPDKSKGGRPRTPNRACLAGIMFVLQTGCPWNLIPEELGCDGGSTCWRRFEEWTKAGAWEKLHAKLLSEQIELLKTSVGSVMKIFEPHPQTTNSDPAAPLPLFPPLATLPDMQLRLPSLENRMSLFRTHHSETKLFTIKPKRLLQIIHGKYKNGFTKSKLHSLLRLSKEPLYLP